MNLTRLIHGTGAAALIVAAALLTGRPASAQELLPAWTAAAELTPEQAAARAQREVPGRVLEVERERERGRVVYEVEIRRDDGRVFEVVLDAVTGAVLETEAEDDEDDDDEDDEDEGADDD